jgi:MFS family permease
MSEKTETVTPEQAYWREVARHGRHNLIVHIAQGGTGILGLSFFIPHTVLATFVATMTDSTFLIGLPAAITGFAWDFPMLFYSYIVQRHKQRKEVALKAGASVRFAFVGMAASAYIASRYGAGAGLTVFFASLALMSCTAGGSAMAWQDLTGRTLPPARRGFFFGLREASAGLAGFAGAVFLSFYLRHRAEGAAEGYVGSPTDYIVPFALGAALYFVSWYVLVYVREPEWPGEGVPAGSWRRYYSDSFAILRSDRNFRTYVYVKCLLALTGIFNIALFASYALKQFGISPAVVAGVFSGMQLLGRTLMGPLSGRVADRLGFKVTLLAGIVMLAVVLVLGLALPLAPGAALAIFLVIYFLTGALNSTLWVSQFNLQMEFGRTEDRVRYISLACTLSAPVSLIAAGSSGWLVGIFGYGPMLAAALVVTVGVWTVVHHIFVDPRKARSAAETI